VTERPYFSVVIPYYNRLPYLQRVLQALSDQDIPPEELEIVIGSLEYSEALARILTHLPVRLRVRCIMTREPWNVSRARNLAFSHAEGDVLVILDADMLLPRSFLRDLRDNHDLAHRDCAVVGQMLNYSAYTPVTEENLSPYEYYRDTFLSRNCRDGLGIDGRWTRQRKIPWSLCWTALMAVPRRLIEQYSLYFDQTFTGWGVEDLEWAFRLQRSGIPIVLADDLWGIHLPHLRCVTKNRSEQEQNYHRLLCKWPCFEVEVVTRFGVYIANQQFDELSGVWQKACGDGQALLSIEFFVGGSRRLAVGVVEDASGRLLNSDQIPDIGAATATRRIPLLGLRLPYEDHSLHTAYLLPSLSNVPTDLYTLIRSESERISGATVVV
jgi:GT2 family glycosyltransferase